MGSLQGPTWAGRVQTAAKVGWLRQVGLQWGPLRPGGKKGMRIRGGGMGRGGMEKEGEEGGEGGSIIILNILSVLGHCNTPSLQMWHTGFLHVGALFYF